MTAIDLLSEAINNLVSMVVELKREVSDLRTKVEVEKSVANRLREEFAEKAAKKDGHK
jgi:outer membrane murein-binding lipoprotein Lpp